MIRKEKEERMQMEMICMDNLVSEDHLLRKIDSALDFTKIYNLQNGIISFPVRS